MLPDSEHDSSGLSETTPTVPMPGRRSRIVAAMLGSWATGALEMLPSASKPDAQAAGDLS